MDDLVQWLGEQLDQEEQQAFAAGNTLGGRLMLTWRAAGSGVEVDGMRRPVNEPLVVTNRLMEDMPGYDVERARALHIASNDPDRVMGKIDAMWRLIARGGPFCTSGCGDPGNEPMNPDANWATPLKHHSDCAAYEAARVLALPYADRPGYREEWRP